jgi:GR25 family glycosyltransferase involved in LPS biosynthesis
MIHGFYINLDHRTDRREHIETQFADISGKIQLMRFPAMPHTFGAVGCSHSHIACLQIAQQCDWDYAMILEDDFELFGSASDFLQVIEEHIKKDWDVLLLSGWVRKRSNDIENGLLQVQECQTALAYIVRKHYYTTLLANYKESVHYLENLGKSGEPAYALDQYWKRLQTKDKWYICVPILGKQLCGRSDIVGRDVNYNDYFLHSEWNRSLVPKGVF